MQININRLRIHARHGVLPMEQTVGQDFEVSLTINIAYDGTDSLDATVNYAELCRLITAEMQQPSALIEHAAKRLCRTICAAFPAIAGGRLTLLKLAPPMPYDVDSVGVTVEWSNGDSIKIS